MTDHTPGPWRFELTHTDTHAYSIRGSDNHRWLTDGKGRVAFIPRSTVMPMEANARLIAAAPDLLDACLRALDTDGPPAIEYLWAAVVKATREKQ